jgi:hypothetical protein
MGALPQLRGDLATTDSQLQTVSMQLDGVDANVKGVIDSNVCQILPPLKKVN